MTNRPTRLPLKRVLTVGGGVLAVVLTMGLTPASEAVGRPASMSGTIADDAGPWSLADSSRARSASLQQSSLEVEAARIEDLLESREQNETSRSSRIRTEAARLLDLARFQWPTKGGVSSGFGMRKHPILGYTRLHNGADIGGACGNPIYAAQSGEVLSAGYSGSSGNNVRLDHGEIEGRRIETAYLHMSKLAVKTGQAVDKGDVIGYVGSTGLSTACHLHLALYRDGSGSDPLDYLVRP